MRAGDDTFGACAAGIRTCAAGAGPPACAHDPCTPGAELDPLCDPCVNAVCLIDEMCCKLSWDVFCVGTAQVHCACP